MTRPSVTLIWTAWSTFGPHAIGTEWSVTVSSGTSFAQVAGAMLGEQDRVQNPDKDEAGGSSPPRPTTSKNTTHSGVRNRFVGRAPDDTS